MKLLSYSYNGSTCAGVLDGDAVIELGAQPLESWFSKIDEIEAVIEDAPRLKLEDVTLMQPIIRPGKILGIGLNYAAHAKESVSLMDKKPGSGQTWFNKQATAANGPYAPIMLPAVSECLDYESEMVAVVGKKARHVPEDCAMEVIAGICIGNDVSVRDWQRASKTMIMGKGFDTHAPFGPWITTLDEIDDIYDLEIRSFVNGEMRQQSKAEKMLDKLPAQIAHLTAAFTLEPGDVIFTGTPAGVAAGHNPPKWLKVGDVVRCEIDGLGHIENKVVAESGEMRLG